MSVESKGDWEVFHSHQSGRDMLYGNDWKQVPCVAITKQGFTLNAFITPVFGIEKGDRVLLYFHAPSRTLAIKKVAADEAWDGTYSVRGNAHKRSDTLMVGARQLTNKVADCRGKAFRARLNTTHEILGRIVEVELTQQNQSR